VAYLIRGDIVLKPHVTDDVAKYRDQFRRRVERGQCFQRPYLGCREFSADFAPADGSETPIAATEDFGRMLFDQVFQPTPGGTSSWRTSDEQGTRSEEGIIQPQFFDARLENGVLRIPRNLYSQGE
jgi:CRISPR-associated protein Cas5d